MESEMKKRAMCKANTARKVKGRVWRSLHY